MKLQQTINYQIDNTGHWLTGARVVCSPNYDDRPNNTAIDLLVIHGISLPPGQYGNGYIDQLFTNTLVAAAHPYFKTISSLHVSSHLLIDRGGEVTQYVPFTGRAWHAGISSFAGRDSCNDYSIGIELEGCDDEAYTEIQYQRLARITDIICKHWKLITKDRIVRHSDIAADRKTDPGTVFNKHYYFSLLTI